MWYIILGYLIVSAIFAILFWLVLIAAKRKDEGDSVESLDDSEEREIKLMNSSALRMDMTKPRVSRK